MFIPFEQLRPEARLWVYQASRPLTASEVRTIETAIQPALATWAAHGHPLLASAQVVENRFLLLGVDEEAGLPSGCSIDASVRTVQGLAQQLSQAGEPVDFMDRSAIYRAADGSVQSLALPAIKAAVGGGELTPETPVFNTLIRTKAEFTDRWQLPARATWLNRYFAKTPVA